MKKIILLITFLSLTLAESAQERQSKHDMMLSRQAHVEMRTARDIKKVKQKKISNDDQKILSLKKKIEVANLTKIYPQRYWDIPHKFTLLGSQYAVAKKENSYEELVKILTDISNYKNQTNIERK